MKIYIYKSLGKIKADVLDETNNIRHTLKNEDIIYDYIEKKFFKKNITMHIAEDEYYILADNEDIACVISKKILEDAKFKEISTDLKYFFENKLIGKVENKLASKEARDAKRAIRKHKATKITDKRNKIAALSLSTVVLLGCSKVNVQKKINTETISDTFNNVSLIIKDSNTQYIQSDSVNENTNLKNEKIYTPCSIDDMFGSLTVGSEYNEYVSNKVENFLKTKAGIQLIESCNEYNVDLPLAVALAISESSLDHYETLPEGDRFNGYAYGTFQIENIHLGSSFTAYNSKTNTYDTIEITEKTLSDPEINVQIGIMHFSSLLEKYDNNFLLATIAYNMGEGTVNIITGKLCEEYGFTTEEIKKIYDYNLFIDEVIQINQNPAQYLNTVSEKIKNLNSKTCEEYINWQHGTYGSASNISKVVNHYNGTVEDLCNINQKTK